MTPTIDNATVVETGTMIIESVGFSSVNKTNVINNYTWSAHSVIIPLLVEVVTVVAAESVLLFCGNCGVIDNVEPLLEVDVVTFMSIICVADGSGDSVKCDCGVGNDDIDEEGERDSAFSVFGAQVIFTTADIFCQHLTRCFFVHPVNTQ